MDPDGTGPDNSLSGRPEIHYEGTIKQLLPPIEAVLKMVFVGYERVMITQELGGFSQSRVLIVYPHHLDGSTDLPLVVKIGPAWLIQREQEAYHRYIRDKLPGRVELARAALTDTWGGLGYRLVGDGQFKHESLYQFCHRSEIETIGELLRGRLFKRLKTLWDNAPRLSSGSYSAARYDLLLPVHLVIAPKSLPPTVLLHLLTPERIRDDPLTQGDAVRLEGFVTVEVDPSTQSVTVDLPRPGFSHRLRLQPVTLFEAYQLGHPIPPTEGVVVQTRQAQLQAEAKKAASISCSFELTEESLILSTGQVLPNPLALVPALLGTWPAVKLAYLHGDLNLENILIDPATGDITLIDFANSGEEHLLHDLLHLETNVVTHLLSEALVEVGESPELIYWLFYERLHWAATRNPSFFVPPPLLQPGLKKLFIILAAIRQTAQEYLLEPQDWSEYYRGLALHLLGALKFKNLDETLVAPYPKQVALLGAAIAVNLWQQPEERPTLAAQINKLLLLKTQLQRELADKFDFSLHTETLSWPKRVALLNPLVQLPQLLDPWLEGRLACIHGQFDLDAIVSELKMEDFQLPIGVTQPDYRLHALLSLETRLITGLLTQALAEAGEAPEIIYFLFYERLHRAIQGNPAQFIPSKLLPPALRKSFELLAAIRRFHVDWTEYYQGLALYLLGVLRTGQLETRPEAQTLKRLVFLVAAIAVDLWHNPNKRPQPDMPYKGLHTFLEEDAPFFFGRETFVEGLVAEMERKPLVVIAGSSGSGKSSVIFAGLLPRLRQEAGWLILSFRPGNAPFHELARSLNLTLEDQANEAAINALAEELEQGRQSLEVIASRLLHARPEATHLLLIADQFEELYTLCDPVIRQRFLDVLIQILPTPMPVNSGDRLPPGSIASLHLVLTLRADFMGQALTYRPLAEAMQAAEMKLLGAMTRPELVRAIEYPAEKLGVSFEPGLVERIVDDVGDEPGRLPLLEFALTLLWSLQSDSRLTAAAYEVIGRVSGAVTYYAEHIYSDLPSGQQVQARTIFTQLVQPGIGTEDTRRVATKVELAPNWPLVQYLTNTRLVVTNQDPSGIEIVEVVHEALIRNWDRLRQWMETDRTFRAWQERLRVAISQWDQNDRDEGGLLRGISMAEAEAWLNQRGDDLSQAEQDFILHSLALRERQRARAEAERQHQLAQAQALAEEQRQRAETERQRALEQAQAAVKLRRRATWLTIALGLLLLAVLVAIIFGVQAHRQLRRAVSRQLVAQSLGLIDEPDQVRLALLMSLEAQRIENATEAKDALLTGLQMHPHLLATLRDHTNEVIGVAFSPDGRTLASSSVDQTIRLWDVSDPAQPRPLGAPLTGHTDAISSVAFSPDGRTLASGSKDKTIRLWDVSDPAQPRPLGAPLTGHTDEMNSVSFSSDGRMLASASADQTIRLWDITDPAQPRPLGAPLTGHTGEVRSIAFSPDGQTLASGSWDSTLRLWDIGDPARPLLLGAPLIGHDDKVRNVRFSPDGRTLASGSEDKTIRLWDVSDPAQPQPLGAPLIGHDDKVKSIAFSPDGRTLASGGADKILRLWDVSDPARPLLLSVPLNGHTDEVRSVSFSPDGRTLASGSEDGTLVLWNISDLTQPNSLVTLLSGHTNEVTGVAFSPDGRMLASVSDDQTIRLWDVSNPAQPLPLSVPLTGHTDAVSSVAFSPDGRIVASGSVDQTIRLWDISNPVQPRPMAARLTGHTGEVIKVAFSPDGRMLGSGSRDSTLRLWDVSDPAQPLLIGAPLSGHTSGVASISFSPDGRTLASGSWDSTLRLWDVSDPVRPLLIGAPLTGHTGELNSVAFGPEGRTLASGSVDKTLRLWDVSDPVQPLLLGVPFIGHTAEVRSVNFSPDGRILASSSEDQTIRLWNTDPDFWHARACRMAGRNLTQVEIKKYIPVEFRLQLGELPVCPNFPYPAPD